MLVRIQLIDIKRNTNRSFYITNSNYFRFVVRSSDKSDLGLSELHQLNVKERYNIFEHAKKDEPHYMLDREERVLKRGNTVLSKLAK